MSLINFLRGGDEDFMASNQPLDQTSSSFPGFFMGIVIYFPEDNRLEWMPSLDLFIGTGSVRTGDE